jgi:hypothetical protein
VSKTVLFAISVTARREDGGGRARMQNFYHHIPGLFHYVFVLQGRHRSGRRSADCLSATVVLELWSSTLMESWPLFLPNIVEILLCITIITFRKLR